MAPVTQGWLMTSPSSDPELSIQRAMRSDPNKRIRSSSRERKNTLWPGSPWRPERPRSWRSMRRASPRGTPFLGLARPFPVAGFVLRAAGFFDGSLLVAPPHRAVGGDHDHLELVDLVELRLLGLGGPGHAGQLLVHPEVVLDRD